LSNYYISSTFSTIPPSIKLCDQQSFRPSSIRGKAEEMVAQMSRHHTRLANRLEKQLLLRRQDWGGGRLRQLYHIDNGLR
jgi:hypothetical protein